MKFQKLRLKNFRQFYGEQELEFSTDKERNVTVIHGRNGSGKSTILNAFLWVFYKDINLPKSHDLASERAVAELEYGDTVEVEAEITFTHEGESYTAVRSEEYKMRSKGGMITESTNSDIRLTVAGQEKGNPEVILQRILPERLKELFLFHGENIDELSEEDNQDQIKEAIRNIMGLEILERSTKHLGKVAKKFRREVQQKGGEDINSLIDELESLESRKDSKQDKLDTVKDELGSIDRKMDDVEEELAELQGLEEIKNRKDDLKSQKKGLESDIEDINEDIKSRISDDGYLVFGVSAVQEAVEKLQNVETESNDETEEDEIEVPENVLNTLLNEEECLCGRDLSEGSDPYSEIKQLVEQAVEEEDNSRDIVEQVRDKASDRLRDIIQDRRDLFEFIIDKESRKEKLRKRIDGPGGIAEELDEIEEKLSKGDTERIEELKDKKESLSNKEDKLDRKQGRLEKDIEDLTEEIENKQDEIEEKKAKKEKVELAKRRQKVANEARDSLEETFEEYQDTVRDAVNEKVNEIFRDIIAKDYYVEITESYKMRVKKDVGEKDSVSVAKSTGERQVASLSFIASLIQIAKERYESQEDAAYFTGGIYPIIMDSPFGYLDPEYQRKVSDTMPKMAEQVIVLVTDSQWSEEVREEMEDIAGREYHLDYRNPRQSDIEYEETKIKPKRANITGGA